MTKSLSQTPIFLHIPKTAGTTLYGIIWRHYTEEETYTIDGVNHRLPDFMKLDDTQKAKIRILTGHINYGLHEYLPQPTTYFTLLRNPVDLTVSYYYFLRSRWDHPHHQLATDMDIVTFMNSHTDVNMCNTQTRMLVGKSDPSAYYECTRDDLETAKRNLRHSFSVVGLTEAFDETLILLRRVYGWQNLYYARMNVTRKRPSQSDLSPEIINAISQANQLDIELYQYAQTLFQEQINNQGTSFIKEVNRFKRTNRQFYPIVYTYWLIRRNTTLAYRRILHNLRLLRARLPK